MNAIRTLTLRPGTERKNVAKFETCQSTSPLCSDHSTFKWRITMFSIFRTLITFVFCLSLGITVFAQTRRSNGNASSPIVTATTSNGHVRYASLGEVNQTRLQVFAVDGRQVYDSDLRLGNLIDWSLLDQQGQRLTDGSYAFLITVREFSGTLTQKYGTALLENDHVTLQQAAREEMPQSQALALQANKVADVLGAVDRIGAAALTATPVVSTEVVPVIEPVPSVKKSASTITTAVAAPGAESLTGTGTQNRLAKWTDNAGTLGDSVITESSGNIGIGTTSPTHKLDVQTTGANGAIRSVNETAGVRGLISEQHSSNVVGAVFVGLKSRGTLAAPTAVVPNDFGAFFSNKWYDGTSYVQSGAFGFTVDGPVSTGVVPTRLSFVTSTTSGDGATAHGVERMTILSGGNVGIGTTLPAARLHVAGTTSSTATPIAIIESSGVQMPISFRQGGTEMARIRANSAGDLVFATTNGSDKDIFFRAGDDSSTDMFIQSSTGNVGIGTTSPDANAKLDVNNGAILSSGSAGGRLSANNPNNQSASVHLDWFNDVARIRYGGSGAGAANGFVIQGQGDDRKLSVDNDGDLFVVGDIEGGNRFFFGTSVPSTIAGFPQQDACFRPLAVDRLQLTECSSSIRYKTDVRGFTPGLDLARRLRPVSFRWKGSSSPDVGLIAEEVARVEPLLVTRNSKGEIVGVKYDRIGVVLLNAVREQQAQIKTQQQQLSAKDERIANLAARLARYESNFARYDSRLASLERSVAGGKRTKRQVAARVNSTRKRWLRRAAPSKAD